METAGTVADFIQAVRRIEGLEWMAEIEEEDVPPDDDFFVKDKTTGEPTDKSYRGRMFLVLSNQRALDEVLSLWARWLGNQELPIGFRKWKALFSQLRDVRNWGVEDRLAETGVLDDWRERVQYGHETVPCEIELWYRADGDARRSAVERVIGMVETLGGEALQQSSIAEIAYHAVLARLPVEEIESLFEDVAADVDLVQCEAIQFLRASGQMSGVVVSDDEAPDEGEIPEDIALLGPPVVALLDGLPMQNHARLEGRLIVDDPDGLETDYPARDRRHGTAMSSLILHGDLGAGEPPLARKLYVRPILRPDARDWRSPRPESAPEDELVVDLVHRAVRRIVEGDGREPAAAPQVCVVNLSIGIRDRVFHSALSPLARLLDWLSWRHKLLFVVSAGNHNHAVRIEVPHAEFHDLTPDALQVHVVQAIAADARHRRILSPAEALNVLTIGAAHSDASVETPVTGAASAYVLEDLPSVISAQGMGYRRSIKPDLLAQGGKIVLSPSAHQPDPDRCTVLDVYEGPRAPGQAVATAGVRAGDLSRFCYTRGTSNATALMSRGASQIYDVVEELAAEPGGDLLDQAPRAVWLKTLLGHGARWGVGGRALTEILETPENRRQFREYLTRLIGYGAPVPGISVECMSHRATALGCGTLHAEESHIHRVPLPPSLSEVEGMRRLTVTLAWFSPVNARHQGWRRAQLWFTPTHQRLKVDRQEAQWQAVRRGTLQHEVFEGDRAAAFVDGDQLEIQVNCCEDAGTLEDPIPYALAVTLEVAEELGIDVYNEVRLRVQAARIGVAPRS